MKCRLMKCKRRRTLYRYVDWNLDRIEGIEHDLVVPYIGTWIETNIKSGNIDPNDVVPYIGTWIETCYSDSHRII